MDKSCSNCQAAVSAEGYPSLLECRRHAPVVIMDTRSEDRFPKVRPGWWCEEFIKKVEPVFKTADDVNPTPVSTIKAESRTISESMGMPKKPELSVTKSSYVLPIAVKKPVNKPVSKPAVKIAAKPAGKR